MNAHQFCGRMTHSIFLKNDTTIANFGNLSETQMQPKVGLLLHPSWDPIDIFQTVPIEFAFPTFIAIEDSKTYLVAAINQTHR
jgi:hypothetical protein